MSLFPALPAQLSLLLASQLVAESPAARDDSLVAPPWLGTRHGSFPVPQALLSLTLCFLTLTEPIMALQDSLTALPWSRTRHESFPALQLC